MPINNFYKRLIISILLLLLLSCSDKVQQREKITIGTTFQINNTSTISLGNNAVFQWWVGNYPENSDYTLEPIGDKALFTPDILGEYDIYVSIRDSNDIEIDLIEFYFISVLDKIKPKTKNIISDKALNQLESNLTDSLLAIDTTQIESSSDTIKKGLIKLVPKKSSKKKIIKSQHHIGWTIQLSSRTSLELAKKDQLLANKNGYDAYIEQVTIKKTNQIWYRVRIGNFKTKATAMTIQSELKSFWGNDTWIDRVKTK